MQDEDCLPRPPSPRPYQPTSAVLVVSPATVKATRNLLQRAGRNEACVFWYGERHGEISRVLSVRAPAQKSFRGNYHVEPDSMSRMVRDLPESWRPLAQIHSHPGLDAEHSRYDDRMMSSRKILSIVFPVYGASTAPWPRGLGVHEWQIDYWHMLSPQQIQARLSLQEIDDLDVRDFR
jgi:hypothetical protein